MSTNKDRDVELGYEKVRKKSLSFLKKYGKYFWITFKIIYPFIVTILIIIIAAILMAIPAIGQMIGIFSIIMFLISYIFTYPPVFWKIYKSKKISMKSPYTWICYILYAGIIPGGTYIVNLELDAIID